VRLKYSDFTFLGMYRPAIAYLSTWRETGMAGWIRKTWAVLHTSRYWMQKMTEITKCSFENITFCFYLHASKV